MDSIKIKCKSYYVILWLQTLKILNRLKKQISDFSFFLFKMELVLALEI